MVQDEEDLEMLHAILLEMEREREMARERGLQCFPAQFYQSRDSQARRVQWA